MAVFRSAAFLDLLTPAQRNNLLRAQVVFTKEPEEHQSAKCSERFPDFQDSCAKDARGKDEQPVLENTPCT